MTKSEIRAARRSASRMTMEKAKERIEGIRAEVHGCGDRLGKWADLLADCIRLFYYPSQNSGQCDDEIIRMVLREYEKE